MLHLFSGTYVLICFSKLAIVIYMLHSVTNRIAEPLRLWG
jgi:hypothetical protein